MASETIYDHPRYYDLLFGWDRSREADFYDRVFRRLGVEPGEPILEVACGPGRVACLLARRGWRVTGLDLSPGMLALLGERAAREGVRVETLCADMTAFRTATRFAAACNPLSSFRLLRSDAEAQAHLAATAAALRPGGVYVLDMTFLASDDEPALTTDESWEMAEGGVTVRAGNDAIVVNDHGVRRVLAWGREGHLRGTTAAAFAGLVTAGGDFEIESWHPESGRATGVSEFGERGNATAPASGRTMVVLRRRGVSGTPGPPPR